MQFEIVPEAPFEDGVAAGKEIGKKGLRQRTEKLLKDPYIKDTLGAMERAELTAYVTARMETPPDYGRYPELEDIYPERLEYLRGLAEGAGCSLEEAAVADYVAYRQEIDSWHGSLQLQRQPGKCSGILMVGPDGVIGGQSVESGPPPKPKDYKYKPVKPYSGLKSLAARTPKLTLRKPKTGYIADWGVGNEKGVTQICGNSCSVWLDEPIEDTWPIKTFPLLRFARDVNHLEELYRRYTLHSWNRSSQIWADVSGNAICVEKSFRRIGIRRIKDGVLWCTEGHWESPEMHGYIRAKRLEYVERAGKNLGAGDLQYATDCAVRFTHIGELCYEDWGRGYEHIRRILTNHATFPRAICRHGGPDTDAYDESVTMDSWFSDLTHNRSFHRKWEAWKKFPCQVPEVVTQYPARP